VHHLARQHPTERFLDEPPVVLGRRVHRRVVRPARARVHDRPRREESGQPAWREEQLGRDRPAQEDVVVEVEKVLGQPGDPVQPRLDGVRVERGQLPGAAEDLAVADHGDARILGVQPIRHLVVTHQEDPPDPGREAVQRTQRVAQLVAAGEPGPVRAVRAGRRHPPVLAQRLGLAPAPLRIGAVDPGVDRVDRE